MNTELSNEEFLIRFGGKLKKLRVFKNLSYRQMAQRCDLDYSYISKIEKGQHNIQLTTVLELSKGLDIMPKELFDF
ncbi:helix-turn-helix domain-containing protein [Gillisia sp. JM1]|uniref:helix-turn-helix domain-containing protein n=1 Tax=Gillisia sp. JM1 TaxID=1283286 RepID=UPI00047E3DFE|nr:helix-turn-helix transcriptional regulator [Gillisia sp. JM1]